MSGAEHDAYFESLGAYALGAMPESERAAVAAHLETCPVCAEDAASLQRAATALIGSVPKLEPSPELRGRIMAVVESEAALLRAASAPPDRAEARSTLRQRSDPFLRLRWVATAAALVIAGGAIGVLANSGGGGGTTRTIRADAGGVAQRAYVEIKGGHAQLVVDKLAAPPAGKVWEVWVQHRAQAARPGGSLFVVRSGHVDIPAGVGRGDRVMVTAEPPGGSPAPTGRPVVVSNFV